MLGFGSLSEISGGDATTGPKVSKSTGNIKKHVQDIKANNLPPADEETNQLKAEINTLINEITQMETHLIHLLEERDELELDLWQAQRLQERAEGKAELVEGIIEWWDAEEDIFARKKKLVVAKAEERLANYSQVAFIVALAILVPLMGLAPMRSLVEFACSVLGTIWTIGVVLAYWIQRKESEIEALTVAELENEYFESVIKLKEMVKGVEGVILDEECLAW
ncbi:hypothetical protein HK102_001342 [Quaeritorhiza haematococci]|nr:hypothetical protein HK102_001342 [Quaeritorhiza haematococci]